MNRNLIGAALILTLSLAACSSPTPPVVTPDPMPVPQPVPQPGPQPVPQPVPQPGFSLDLTPATVSLQADGTAELNAALQRSGGFAGEVTLTLLNPPEGLSAAAVTVPAGATTATLTLKASSASVLGQDTLTFAADAGSLHNTVQVKINVTAAPVPAGQAALSLVTTPGSLTVKAGQPTTFSVKVTRSNFTGPVTLHLRNLPANVTAADTVIPEGQDSAEMTLTQTGKTPAGSSTVQLQASSDALKTSLNIPLTVEGPAGLPAAPTVSATSPASNAQAVNSAGLNLNVTFSQDMKSDVAKAVTITPEVPGFFCAVSDGGADLKQVGCTGDFQPGVTYSVTVATTAQNTAGVALAQPYTFSFKTVPIILIPPIGDVTPPTVTGFTPTNNSIGVAHSPLSITVNFSEAMNKTAAQNAFQLVVPNVTDSKKSFAWNAAGTVMTMTYNEVLPYGTTVIWGMSNTATDLAGNPLAQAGSVGGSYRLVRQNSVKLYSHELLSRNLSYNVDTKEIGQTGGQYYQYLIGRGKLGNDRYIERAFLQFPLTSLPDYNKISKINSAVLNIYTISHVNNPELLGDLDAVNISTPFTQQTDQLWNAPVANSGQTLRHIYQVPGPAVGYHTLDITVPFINNLKYPAQSAGMSQWRIQREFDDYLSSQDFNYHQTNIGSQSVSDINKRPYIQVTYEYP